MCLFSLSRSLSLSLSLFSNGVGRFSPSSQLTAVSRLENGRGIRKGLLMGYLLGTFPWGEKLLIRCFPKNERKIGALFFFFLSPLSLSLS